MLKKLTVNLSQVYYRLLSSQLSPLACSILSRYILTSIISVRILLINFFQLLKRKNIGCRALILILSFTSLQTFFLKKLVLTKAICCSENISIILNDHEVFVQAFVVFYLIFNTV